MAQQTNLTAVEWLIEQLEGDDSKIARIIGLKEYNTITKQAKAMHKEECENAWMDGFDFNSNYKDFEDYYNQNL